MGTDLSAQMERADKMRSIWPRINKVGWDLRGRSHQIFFRFKKPGELAAPYPLSESALVTLNEPVQ
jgi:hypothetical protein